MNGRFLSSDRIHFDDDGDYYQVVVNVVKNSPFFFVCHCKFFD